VVVVMVGFQTFPGRTKPCNPVFAKMQKKKKKKKKKKTKHKKQFKPKKNQKKREKKNFQIPTK